MDLFDLHREEVKTKEEPLAARMRPETLDDVVGQEHIIGPGRLLYRAIKADKLGSIIFYGPPGTGKTTLARVIANTTSANFSQVNATTAGKKDLAAVVEQAKESLGRFGHRTILFIDEIHRFNKTQQDFLLPFVEDGTVILIGATTENPYFEVNGALLSRSRIFELKPLSREDIILLIHRAVYEDKRGYAGQNVEIDEDAAEFLADASGGDARAALNGIELAVLTTERNEHGMIHIDLDVAQECIQRKALRYDKDGDSHYDTISAFIKSMRGSDPDAATYYLARMIEAGEDERFIARRMMICASEDVGNADPMAIVVASAAAQAVERVGMPEAQIILSQCANYIACCPKSNASCNAIFAAKREVEESGPLQVPPYLKDAHYNSAAKLGRGVGYKYAHDYENHYVEQQYLPDEIKDKKFYEPTEIGHEKDIIEYFKKIGKIDPETDE